MTVGIGLQPERLLHALASKGWTRADLAKNLGVSAPTVSKWCKGEQSPEANTFISLAEILEVEPEWLTRLPRKPLLNPLFRSASTAPKAARNLLQAHLRSLDDVSCNFLEYVDYPAVNLPIRKFKTASSITTQDIEDAAAECRKLWQLSLAPIQNLVLAAEGAGILISREETGISLIEALSDWSEESQHPLVFLSADKANGFRSRFDLAHEIGHLILHRGLDAPDTSSEDGRLIYNLMESQAHKFAGALLLPAETFVEDVRLPVTLDNLLLLKQRWGVSVGAMIMRLHALNVISDDEKGNLFKRRSARWGSKAEPLDDYWKPEQPRLLRKTVEILINSGVMDVNGLRRFIGISPQRVESLCSLRTGFFESSSQVIDFTLVKKRFSSSNNSKSTGANVVNLFSKK